MADRPDSLTFPRDAPWRVVAFWSPLAVLQVAWLAWFLWVPLPNARGGLNRLMIVSQALPEVVPGVTLAESHLGRVVLDLAHLEFLPQRGPIVLVGLGIALAAIGLGQILLRLLNLGHVLNRVERIPLVFLLGAVGLALATLALGRLGALRPWPVRLALIVLAGAGLAWEWRTPRPPAANPRAPGWGFLGFALVASPFLILMALASMLPTIDFDALEYHLQGPKEYLQNGKITFLPHNVYTSMPFGVEMLHLLAMVTADDWWRGALAGQLLVMLHAPIGAAFTALTASRLGSPRAAWVAALVYLSAPWIYRMAAIPYVEGPLIAYHAALIWAVVRAWDEPSAASKLWGLAGVLAGGALACKYPALISAVLPFGALALVAAVSRRSWRIPLAFTLGLTLAAGPWFLKNAIEHGNPVYPLGGKVFGGHPWSPDRDAKWAHAHGPKPINLHELTNSLVDVAGRSDWQSPLFLALAPLALLRTGTRRAALALWAYAAYLFATWWLFTHRLDRFWLPILAPLGVLAGLGADWTRRRGWTPLLAGILAPALFANLTYDTTALVALNDWTANLEQLRLSVPAMLNPPLARLDEELPPTARILMVGQAAVFHLRHPVVYNTVFDDEIIEGLARDRTPEQVRQSLARRKVTHLYVDWSEVARYRSPGNYGFTPFVTPEVFTKLVRAGVLGSPKHWGPRQDLYRVTP